MIVPTYRGIPAAGNTGNPAILLLSVNAGFIHANLGLRWLHANLAELRDRTGILEGTRRLGTAALAAAAAALQPVIVGISVSIWNHKESADLIAALRGLLPRLWIVVGGPEASYLAGGHPLFSEVDVLVRGEGEAVFAGLCRDLLAADPAAPRRLREIQAGQADLTELTLPYDSLHDSDLARRLIYIETSRGCPFACEFCLSSVQGRVRTFPLEPVLQAIRGLYERGGRSFKVIDRTFNLDYPRARRILELFLELLSSGRNPGATVQFEVVPDRLPGELRELIRQFPPDTLRLEVGIQSFDNAAAARINRRQEQEKTLENLRFLTRETRAVLHADLIIGLPGESAAGFAAGFDRLWGLQPDEIQLGVLKALPGTTLHRHDAEWGMVWNPDPPYEILETGSVPRDEMDELKRMAKYWELVVNRGRFPELVRQLLPADPSGEAGALARFRELSRFLYDRLQRTWGIDVRELREGITAFLRERQGDA